MCEPLRPRLTAQVIRDREKEKRDEIDNFYNKEWKKEFIAKKYNLEPYWILTDASQLFEENKDFHEMFVNLFEYIY